MGKVVDLSTWRGRMYASRIELRLSSAALSRRLQKNDNWASQVENGHGSPDPETLALLARELGRSVEWLVTGAETGRSEFVDAMASYDNRLQSRSKRLLVELATREAALYPVAAGDLDLSDFSDGERSAVLDAPVEQRQIVYDTIQRLRATRPATAAPGTRAARPRREVNQAG